MTLAERFSVLLEQAQASMAYWRDIAVTDFSRELQAKIKKQGGLSHAYIAQRMGTSRPYVTKLLNGGGNFTLETMVKLAMAVGSVVRIRLEDREDDVSDTEAPLAKISSIAQHRAMRAIASPEGAGDTVATLGRR